MNGDFYLYVFNKERIRCVYKYDSKIFDHGLFLDVLGIIIPILYGIYKSYCINI